MAKNMYLFAIELHHSARIGTPIGFDVKITVDGNFLTFLGTFDL